MRFDLTLVALFAGIVSSRAIEERNKSPKLGHVSTIYSSTVGTWYENIIVRPNGDILVTQLVPKAQIYNINPATGAAHLVTTVPASKASGLVGIAEGPEPDSYVFIGEIFDINTFTFTPKSNAIYKINLKDFKPPYTHTVTAELALKVENATGLNGLAAVDTEKGIYLAADYVAGLIYRLDLNKKKSKVVIANKFTGQPPAGPSGANGLKVYGCHAYWTLNNQNACLARAPINEAGYPTGPPENLTATFTDDFAIDGKGDVYLSLAGENAVGVLKAGKKKVQIVAEGILGATSVAIAKGCQKETLYVATSGNETAWRLGSPNKPAMVVKVELP